jgi:hypothetical protein
MGVAQAPSSSVAIRRIMKWIFLYRKFMVVTGDGLGVSVETTNSHPTPAISGYGCGLLLLAITTLEEGQRGSMKRL